MLKSLHIGRYSTKPEEFRRLVRFFEAIGFERLNSGGADQHSAVLTAPLGMLRLNALSQTWFQPQEREASRWNCPAKSSSPCMARRRSWSRLLKGNSMPQRNGSRS